MSEIADVLPDEDEYIPVPPEERLDRDPNPTSDSDNTALDDATGADDADLDAYADLDGPIMDEPDYGDA